MKITAKCDVVELLKRKVAGRGVDDWFSSIRSTCPEWEEGWRDGIID
jgi:hypothetical protein